MTNDPLTNEEIAALAAAGWKIGGGGLFDGVVKVGGVKGGKRELRTRAEWREELQRVSLPNNPVQPATPIEETQRLLAKIEAQRVALAERDALLVLIEDLARAAGYQSVVEAIVRRGEKQCE